MDQVQEEHCCPRILQINLELHARCSAKRSMWVRSIEDRGPLNPKNFLFATSSNLGVALCGCLRFSNLWSALHNEDAVFGVHATLDVLGRAIESLFNGPTNIGNKLQHLLPVSSICDDWHAMQA